MTVDTLPDDPAALKALILELLASLDKSEKLIGHLQGQLKGLLRARFGKKSEKLDPDQLLLFAREFLEGGEEEVAKEESPQAESPSDNHKAAANPRHKGRGRKTLPASLKRQRVEHDLADAEKVCPCCGEALVRIGEETTEQLEYAPASFVVLEHVRAKYACKACHGHVARAPKLPDPIERGLPGPGLLAHVVTSKYADHLPLYRQEGIFLRHGIELSRKTMCDWTATVADLFDPIVRRMREVILQSRVIQTDDTTAPVLDHERDRTKTGRLWAYLGDAEHPYTVFDYSPDHKHEWPQKWLSGYQGYLLADAFTGYDEIFAKGRVIEVSCWAHARRYFFEAKSSDKLRAHYALAAIGELYAVERTVKDEVETRDRARQEAGEPPMTAAERQNLLEGLRLSRRQEHSVPLLCRFHEWLEAESPKALPKSPIGKAIAYALSNWTALCRYADDGCLDIDNNASERAIKQVVIGRKNWMFAGSDEGGKTAAVLFSIVVTAKRHGIDPFAYFRDVLTRISTHPMCRIDELLPDRWKQLREAAASEASSQIRQAATAQAPKGVAAQPAPDVVHE